MAFGDVHHGCPPRRHWRRRGRAEGRIAHYHLFHLCLSADVGKIIADKHLGVHIPFRKLTAEKLIDAINQASSPSMKQNGLAVSAKINGENGVGEAVFLARA